MEILDADVQRVQALICGIEYQKANNKTIVLNPEGFAKEITEIIMEFEGPQKCQCCSEIFDKKDISGYLEKIKNKEKENVVLLAFTENETDYLLFEGEEDKNKAESYFIRFGSNKMSAVEFINYWSKKGARICNYHNHPARIAAMPSKNDIDSLSQHRYMQPNENNDWNKQVKICRIDIPPSFCYDDWGVVTPFDFFSYQQTMDKSGSLQTIRDNLAEYSKRASDVRKKYILWENCN